MENLTGQMNINDFLDALIEQQPKERKRVAKPATSAITKETRIQSYRQTDKQPLHQLVVSVLGNKQLTAQEIATELHRKGLIAYPARAVIQPRITELVHEGVIKAVSKKEDAATGRKVAVYEAV